MKDVEDRIVSHLGQQIEEQGLMFMHKVDGLEQRVQTIEVNGGRASTSERRAQVLESSQITQGGKINPGKMEAALNDWLCKVEEQVNSIED